VNKRPITGRTVFFVLAGFFSVMFAVNGFFVFRAISSFPGEEEPKSYLQGVAYNEVLQNRRAQEALGWRAEAGVVAGEAGRSLVVAVLTSAGEPVSGVQVGASWRAAGDPEVAVLAVRERADGRFHALLPADVRGRGRFEIEARPAGGAAGSVFSAHKDVVIP